MSSPRPAPAMPSSIRFLDTTTPVVCTGTSLVLSIFAVSRLGRGDGDERGVGVGLAAGIHGDGQGALSDTVVRGQCRRDEDLASQRVRLGGEDLGQRLGVSADHASVAGVGDLLEQGRVLGGKRQSHDVDLDVAVVDALGHSFDVGVGGVATVGQQQEAACALRADGVHRLQEAVVEPGRAAELETVDDARGLGPVERGSLGERDVTREGDDADVQVIGRGLDERLRSSLGLVEPVLPRHAVADVHGQDRRTSDRVDRVRRQLRLGVQLVAVERDGQRAEVGLHATGAGQRVEHLHRAGVAFDVVDAALGSERGSADPRDSHEREQRGHHGDAAQSRRSGRAPHDHSPSIANSIGSTFTLTWASFSRNFGRRPVARRRPRLRPFSSKPMEWS